MSGTTLVTTHATTAEQGPPCRADLTWVRMLARGPGPMPGQEVSAALDRILRAAHAIDEPSTGDCSEPGDRPGMNRLLAIRRARLGHLGEDVLSAIARGDAAVGRASLYRFHALATAILDTRPGARPARSPYAYRPLHARLRLSRTCARPLS
jgi:hypothetical protein